jgi:hypothetical protein
MITEAHDGFSRRYIPSGISTVVRMRTLCIFMAGDRRIGARRCDSIVSRSQTVEAERARPA